MDLEIEKYVNPGTSGAVAIANFNVYARQAQNAGADVSSLVNQARQALDNKNEQAFHTALGSIQEFVQKPSGVEGVPEKSRVLTPAEISQSGLAPNVSYQINERTGDIRPINVRTYESPEEKAQVAAFEDARKVLNDTYVQSREATAGMPKIRRLKTLLDKGLETGKMQSILMPVQQLFPGFQTTGQELADLEEFKSLSGQLSMDFIKLTKGAISNQEMTFFTNVLAPSLGTSAEANRRILDFMEKANEKAQKVSQVIRDGRKKGLNPYDIMEQVEDIQYGEPLIDYGGEEVQSNQPAQPDASQPQPQPSGTAPQFRYNRTTQQIEQF